MPRLMTGRYERVEVITGVARRRRWSAEEKLRMVNEVSPGATVSVARRNDINSRPAVQVAEAGTGGRIRSVGG